MLKSGAFVKGKENMKTRRPLTVIIAIVLLMLLSVFGLITPFGPNGGPPLPIVLFAVIVDGVGGLLAVVGLWRMQRWGLRLSIIIAVLSIFATVPGLFLAPRPGGKVISVVLAVLYALVLVLVALPATRQAVATKRVRATA
jgi:hypothetical protein